MKIIFKTKFKKIITSSHVLFEMGIRAHFNINTVFVGMEIPIIKLGRLWNHLMFIPLLIRRHIYTEMASISNASVHILVSTAI